MNRNIILFLSVPQIHWSNERGAVNAKGSVENDFLLSKKSPLHERRKSAIKIPKISSCEIILKQFRNFDLKVTFLPRTV